MAICQDCGREMTTAMGCDKPYFKQKSTGRLIRRDTALIHGLPAGERCDCGRINKLGNIHHYGCDNERCPLHRGMQLISCYVGKTEEINEAQHDFLPADGSGRVHKPIPIRSRPVNRVNFGGTSMPVLNLPYRRPVLPRRKGWF